MTTVWDGNFEASAEEERFLIDDAMVGGEDGAGVAGVRGEVGVWVGRVGGEAEFDPFVRLAAGSADVWGGRHGSWLVRDDCSCCVAHGGCVQVVKFLRHGWTSSPSRIVGP